MVLVVNCELSMCLEYECCFNSNSAVSSTFVMCLYYYFCFGQVTLSVFMFIP